VPARRAQATRKQNRLKAMPDQQTLEVIPLEALLDKARTQRQLNARLVQISATRLPEQIELTYSFDVGQRLTSYRVVVPASGTPVPSISSIFGCAILYENEIHDLFGLEITGITVDFKGNLYKTAIKFPFGSVKAPVSK
jgi:ech hydrogenase subunit D